jgi:hypothetical protein
VSATRSRLIAVVAALGLVLVGCSGDDGADPDPDVTTTTAPPETTAPAGKPPGATEVGLRDIEVGQCFDTIDDPLVDDLAVWVLSCESMHTYEVYDVIAYDGEGGGPGTDYPGVATVQDWAEQACFDRFEAFVGVRWTTSELDINVWWPSEESWARADRAVICAVMSDTGDQLTGTARDSRA